MTKSGNPVYRNPAAPHIIPMLSNFFALLRVLNELWTPDSLSRLSVVCLPIFIAFQLIVIIGQ